MRATSASNSVEQVGRALLDRRALARDRRLVAARDRAGEGRSAPVAAQFSSAARASGTSSSRGTPAVAASRSAAPSSVTRKLAAIEAAAW